MKRSLFFIAYAATPSIPAILYLRYSGGGFNAYAVSVALGVTAFILICNQFILASRPAFAVKALGLKGLLAFHGAMPLVILVVAAVHRLLKEAAGFPLESAQAKVGAAAWWVFAAAAAFAILFLASFNLPVMTKLKALRAWAQERYHLGYKLARAFHNVTVAGALTVIIHAMLASSSEFTANPLGAAWLLAWAGLSLGMYARYRIRGRKTPAPAPR